MRTLADQNGRPFDYQDPINGCGVITGRGTVEADDATDEGSVVAAMTDLINLGPATSADLLELDAVPDPVDSDAPGALQPPGTALREYLDRDR